ncbi:MAG: type II secretion system protein [Nitrospina sp.]|nr:MAG: type II secretion system protein [Nitrospina sp.]
MIRKMKNEKGFTLIELIMVIVLLGIMAAVAIPTFIDLSQDAEDARRDGAYASYLGSITMLHAQYLLQGTTYTESDVITNTVVSGGTDSQVAGTLTVTWDDGVVNTYGYTAQSGFTAAVLTNP